MQRIIQAILGGVISYIVCTEVIDNLITGTTFAEQIFTSIIPIAIPLAVLLAIFRLGDDNRPKTNF